jgi:hypothetical protein
MSLKNNLQIKDYLFFYLTIIYFSCSYFLFPYISSLINPKYIFYINIQYIFLILLVLITFFFFTITVKLSLNKFEFNKFNLKNDSLLLFAYFLFFLGLASKFNNIFNGSYLDYKYSDTNSDLFIIEYFSSMNVLSLLSLLFFIASFYNKNKPKYIYLFFLPIIYFICFVLFSHGGRNNLIILILFIFLFETYNFLNFKNYILKFFSFFIIFLMLFNFLTLKRDATLLTYIGIHVLDLNKEIYFKELDFKNKKIIDVILRKNFVFFKCKNNLEEYKDRTKYSKYDICQKLGFNDYNIKSETITKNLKIPNTNKLKEVTFNNTLKMNFISNTIYNLTVRLNNYQPLSSLIYLLNNNQLKEREVLNEYKMIMFTYLNSFVKYINYKFNYERNTEVDNFYIKSGIGDENFISGVSPSLIGEIYWIGGYVFIIFYTLKIAIVTFILNRTFTSGNLFLKTISFFFFIQYLSSFEQSFEAHTVLFLKNITILFFCLFLYFLVDKLKSFLVSK